MAISKSRTALKAGLLGVANLCLVLSVLACTATGRKQNIWEDMCRRGAASQFQPILFHTGMFDLSGLMRLHPDVSDQLIVYIEGDGRIFNRRGQVRDNSTPTFAQAYELALLDPAPQVLYLARIGQFNSNNTGSEFKKYWTTARMAPEAVQAANLAIDQAKKLAGASKIQLIGYSGGGGLAGLVAAGRNDVLSLATVAAVLDTVWWTDSYLSETKKGALRLSLNPTDRAEDISTLPQIHFSGRNDELVPPEMVERLQMAVHFQNFQQVILNNTHTQGWTEDWPLLLTRYVIPLRLPAQQRTPLQANGSD